MAVGTALIKVPTQQQLDEAQAHFQNEWGLVDEVLYRLCKEHPDHSSRREVVGKLGLIGRAYSAAMERRVTPPPGQQAIVVIGDYLCERGNQVDAILSRLRSLSEPLSRQDMATAVAEHGRFTALLKGVATDGKTPRSFAAKYLHFHCPVVPIYDSYVAAKIPKVVRWSSNNLPFELPPGSDEEYWHFCVRLLRLYESCRRYGLAVTVKSLDSYLWEVPT